MNNLKKASTPLEKFSLIVDYRIEKQRLFELNKEQIKEFTTEYGLMVLAYKIYKGLESAVENIEDGDLKKEIEDMMVYIEKRDLVKLFWEGDKKSEIAEILNESGVERAQEIVERFFEFVDEKVYETKEVEDVEIRPDMKRKIYPLDFALPSGWFVGKIKKGDAEEEVELALYRHREIDAAYLPWEVGEGENIVLSGRIVYHF